MDAQGKPRRWQSDGNRMWTLCLGPEDCAHGIDDPSAILYKHDGGYYSAEWASVPGFAATVAYEKFGAMNDEDAKRRALYYMLRAVRERLVLLHRIETVAVLAKGL